MAYDLQEMQTKLNVDGYVKLQISSSEIRKTIHKYCEKQPNLTHIGYYDSRYVSNNTNKYWCDVCKIWKLDDEKETRTSYCCIDENGNQGCSDWGILCLHCDNIVWNHDAHEDSSYKRKQKITNNAMLIFIGDVYLEKNRELIKSIGMRTRTIQKKKKNFREKNSI
jgi:hypothetical protein